MKEKTLQLILQNLKDLSSLMNMYVPKKKKMHSREEMDKFQETYNLPRMNPEQKI